MKAILKHGSTSLSTNQKMVKQAQVERRILRRVNHPFVIDLHCAFQTHDKLLLVLEMCPGGDLKSHVSRCGRFPPEVAAFCAAQVLMALEYLHSHHILHRDIKLENVLLDGEGYVRLTDFNVAKVRSRSVELLGHAPNPCLTSHLPLHRCSRSGAPSR